MYLFLDVDGVLNAERRFVRQPKSARVTGWSDWEMSGVCALGRSWPVATSKQMGRALLDLPVNLVWATSWVEHPEQLEDIADLVGLPRGLPRLASYDGGDRRNCGKRYAVEEFLGGSASRPFVWVDDDLGPDDKKLAADHGALTVRPVTGWGLTARQLAEVSEYLASPSV